MSAKSRRLWDKGEPLDQIVHRFTVGSDPSSDLKLARWDILASAAHVRMLFKTGYLSQTESAAILERLQTILSDCDSGAFSIPPELEDCHTTIETLLLERIGPAALKIHTGRSRNDQVLTAIRLYVRHVLVSMIGECLSSVRAVLSRESDIFPIQMPGYTHMQPAMPTSVGCWLQAVAESLMDVVKDGLGLIGRINTNPLGTGSGFGLPISIDRKLTADLMGFSSVQRNPIAVHNSRGRTELQLVRWLSDIALIIDKFASDFLLFSTKEFGFFALPNEFTTGSSLMPQKRNPDVIELMRAGASRFQGAQNEILFVIVKLPSSYHRDLQLTKEVMIRASDSARDLIRIFKHVIGSFSLNKNRLKEAMTPDLFRTFEVFKLVKQGVPFREAYRDVAAGKAIRDSRLISESFASIAEQVVFDTSEIKKEISVLAREVATWETYESNLEKAAFGMLMEDKKQT